jgi:hypothetical protein
MGGSTNWLIFLANEPCSTTYPVFLLFRLIKQKKVDLKKAHLSILTQRKVIKLRPMRICEVCLKLQESICIPVGNTEIHPHRVQQLRHNRNQCQVQNAQLGHGVEKQPEEFRFGTIFIISLSYYVRKYSIF